MSLPFSCTNRGLGVYAKILISSYKISLFAFTKIVLEQSYFLDMIAPYVGIGHNFEFWCSPIRSNNFMLKFKVIYQQGTWPYSNLSKHTYLLMQNVMKKLYSWLSETFWKNPVILIIKNPINDVQKNHRFELSKLGADHSWLY